MNRTAVFGGGCFWCTEAIFKQLKGVSQVLSGYAGGHTEHPTYEDMHDGTNGHAEVIKVTFDPAVITYRELLEIFYAVHDPTTPNQQGNDVGPLPQHCGTNRLPPSCHAWINSGQPSLTTRIISPKTLLPVTVLLSSTPKSRNSVSTSLPNCKPSYSVT